MRGKNKAKTFSITSTRRRKITKKHYKKLSYRQLQNKSSTSNFEDRILIYPKIMIKHKIDLLSNGPKLNIKTNNKKKWNH